MNKKTEENEKDRMELVEIEEGSSSDLGRRN